MNGYRNLDYGIDVTLIEIKRRGERFTESGISLDVQIKSICAVLPDAEAWPYDLRVNNYDDLRDPDNPKPRILVVFVLPDKEEDWLTVTPEHLILRRCAFWHSLHGHPPIDSTSTTRVSILCKNIFTPDALKTLVARIRAGEPLC